LNSFFNKTLTVKRRVNTGTEFHPVYSWTTVQTVNGAQDLLSERRIVRDPGGNILADFVFYMPYTNIYASDVIYCDSQNYTIYSIFNPMEKNHHIEIKALRAKEGEY
jgi:hypothetical protein